MSLKLANKPYTERWQKIERIFSENYSRIYTCKPRDGGDGEYILKIFDNRLYGNDDITDNRTITMNYELGILGLAPTVLDCGYYNNVPLEEGGGYESEESSEESEYTDSSDFTSESESYTQSSESMSGSETDETFERPPKSPHIYYMVLPKYQIDGDKYLMAISMDLDLSQNKKDELYIEYLSQVFDLYNKLSNKCMCSYDAKNRNIVLNFDIDTYKILEMRLIDIDFHMFQRLPNTDKEASAKLAFAAMVLIHYITSKLDGDEDYFSSAYRKYYIGLIDDKLLKYRKYEVFNAKIPFKKLFYCYYKDIDFDEYDSLDKEKQDKLYKSAFKHIAKHLTV